MNVCTIEPTVIMCSGDFVLENGNVNNGNGPYGIGEEVTFTCNDGFVLDGENKIICQDDGTFSNVAPTCNGKHCFIV